MIPPSPVYRLHFGGDRWVAGTVRRLSEVTERPVVVKATKDVPLPLLLADAWAVVQFGSVAGVEALLAGVPVFAGPNDPCLPVSAGDIESVDTPQYKDREPWLADLAYANWTPDEVGKLNLEDYRYSCES